MKGTLKIKLLIIRLKYVVQAINILENLARRDERKSYKCWIFRMIPCVIIN